MPRATQRVPSRNRRKKIIAAAAGYFGRKKNVFKLAKMAVDRARQYAYRDRRDKKGQARRLWVVRINAAARICGTTYSRLIAALLKAQIELDRKVLADLAVSDMAAFQRVVEVAKVA
ncbi:MAG: 50S ribosomal protein L20 [Fibrobacteres bacterium]|nr:50S ribosomal protein L20 [Fibrobacterota bacterium]